MDRQKTKKHSILRSNQDKNILWKEVQKQSLSKLQGRELGGGDFQFSFMNNSGSWNFQYLSIFVRYLFHIKIGDKGVHDVHLGKSFFEVKSILAIWKNMMFEVKKKKVKLTFLKQRRETVKNTKWKLFQTKIWIWTLCTPLSPILKMAEHRY